LLIREYTHAGHTDRVTITRSAAGWDVRQERDDEVVRRVNYTDWHRVERALQLFERVASLDKAIAEAHHGLDLASGRPELRSQASDMDVD
jgi:hypothetical protein